MALIDLGFRPREWQQRALSGLKRFSVVIVHRRGGKTLGAVMKLIDSALRCELPRGRYGYIAPELKQAKAVAWDYLKHYMLKVPGSRINESELWVEAPGGARIRIYGADQPDSLRGLYFDGVVLDEVAQMKPSVWGEILVPSLADRKGWALFIGTPKGINLLSRLYFDGKNDSNWYAELFTIHDTGVLNADELESMKLRMSEREWRQEMLCDFSASGDDTLISIDLITKALGAHLSIEKYNFAAKVIGVDVAAMGGDLSVIQPRQGLAAFKPDVLNLRDPLQIAELVAVKIQSWQADATMVDCSGGWGLSVVSRLRELGFTVQEVQFGGSPRDQRYTNKRTEMWWDMKVWLESGGVLPRMNEYLADLSSPRYGFKDASNRMALETKDSMRSRGLKSPDYADALACTFAYPVAAPRSRQEFGIYDLIDNRHVRGTDYNPIERYADSLKR